MAAKMMFLAKKRGSVPKDLGIDLLILKDKLSLQEPYNNKLEGTAKLFESTEPVESAILDSIGLFRINIDSDNGVIVAGHYLISNQTQPVNVIKGKTANSIYSTILKLGLVKQLEHAAYLGSELSKAEIALRTGKGYVQDADLFSKK
jgi:dihydropteroate synthase-like protein